MTNTQAILSKLRLRLIPNVTKFRVASVEYLDKPLLFGILKKSRRFETAELRQIKRRNQYLMRSYKRLIAYATTIQVEKFENLAMTLIRSSSSYQLAMLCSASKDWYCRKPQWILKLWKKISSIRDSTKIHYERWWIDKKPGDYARPLGAPKIHWKVNMLKYLMVIEIYYHATQVYPEWQHAGTSKRGLVSAWREVLVKAIPAPYIFEFDIKGFFDQIKNQDSVSELPRICKLLNGMVNSKPTKYNLPPEEKDSALQKFLKDSMVITKSHSLFDRVWKVTHTHGPRVFQEDYVRNLLDLPTDIDDEYLEQHKEFYKQRLMYLVTTGMGVATGVKNNVQYFASSDPMAILKSILASKEIEERGDVRNIRLRNEYTERDRALERDRWKGLGRENHGFPQGANFSPFLSCLVLAKAVQFLPGLIMYMDDGLIYANTKAELGQRIRRLKERLETIGLKLAEEKSGIVKTPLEFKGIKFLGIRVHPERDMWSETRSGTIKPARVNLLTKTEYEKLAHYLEIEDASRKYDRNIKALARAGSTEENRLIRLFAESLRVSTASEQRVRDWVVNKSLDPLKALRWAAENSFFSSIVAEIHDPRLSFDDQLQLMGEIKKLNLCLRPGSLSLHVMRLRAARDPLYIPDIQTITSASALELFKRLRRMRKRGKLGSRGGARKITRR
jgi:hypothetical protein